MAAKTTPKKRAPKTAPTTVADFDAQMREIAPNGPITEDGSIRPIEIGVTPDLKLIHLFTLDGKRYFIPEKPPPFVTMTFMREARDPKIGQDQAIENFLYRLLGNEAKEALESSPLVSE